MRAASIGTVLFDLDDTLIEYTQSSADVLAAAFDRVGVDPLFSIPDYHARYDDFLDASEGIDDLRARCFAAILDERGRDPELGRRVAAAYAAERDQTAVRFLPGAEAVLDALSDRPLGIVTNGDPGMQRTKMDALGIRERVDAVVHAGYDTAAKPEPEPFRRALDLLDGTPETAIHLGNPLTTDVPGARAAGLATGWVPADPDASPDPAPDYAFASMKAVLEAPWR